MQEEYHGPVFHGTVGLYEGAEEVLVATDSCGVAAVRDTDCSHSRFCGRAIHLHVVLGLFY